MRRRCLLLLAALTLGACGFHLRRSLVLPSSLRHIHLRVSGNGDLRRYLARALKTMGITVEEQGGQGIAELDVIMAHFSTDSLSINAVARVTEYAVHYHVAFMFKDGAGKLLIPVQHINMSREYSYNASDAVGSQTEMAQLQENLNNDMVRTILLRLEAAVQTSTPVSQGHATAPMVSGH